MRGPRPGSRSRWRIAVGCAVVCTLSGGCSVDPIVTSVQLRLRVADDCRPLDEVSAIEVRALGDFPPSSETVSSLSPRRGTAAIDRFPATTRMLAVGAGDPWGAREPAATRWVAAGTRSVETRGRRVQTDVLLLPLGRSCALGDPELRIPPDAAVAATPGGGLLAAGGIPQGQSSASTRLIRLRGGAPVADEVRETVLGRVGATATRSGREVVIVGGALGAEGVALDRYERYDLDSDTVELGDSRLAQGRRDHAAVRLPDGRVLVVGGVGGGGNPPLDTAEIIDPETGGVRLAGGDASGEAPSRLPAARTEARAVRLDDGTVLVVGGRGEGGSATGSVYAFDSVSETFSAVFDADAPDTQRLQVDERSDGIAVALPGRRMAWLGGAGDEWPANRIELLRRVDDAYVGAPLMDKRQLVIDGLPSALVDVRAVALANGKLLVTGRLPEDGVDEEDGPACDRVLRPGGVRSEPAHCAFVVDLVRQQAHQREAFAPTPRHLVALQDGTIAELGPTGASLRRELVRSLFDNPPATLLVEPDEPAVTWAAPGQWKPAEDGSGLKAQQDRARIDIPTLRFADSEIVVQAEGEGRTELLLSPDGLPATRVQLFADEASVGLCRTTHAAGSPLRVVRRGNELTLDAGGEMRRCTVAGVTGRVGVAVRAAKGIVVRGLRIRRLDARD